MKIVSWNCNCKFRAKYHEVQKLDADIYVIQECEDPSKTNDPGYKLFASNHLWYGKSKDKGLGIFASCSVLLQCNDWENSENSHFISTKVNNSFNLVAVWTGPPYVK